MALMKALRKRSQMEGQRQFAPSPGLELQPGTYFGGVWGISLLFLKSEVYIT